MLRRLLSAALTLLALAGLSRADDSVSTLLKEVRSVGRQGQNSAAARAAWDKLVARGPSVLPQLLEAMDTDDTVVANWLRTAFDRIAEPEIANGGKKISTDALLAFVKDARHHGRARRLALNVVDQLRPGTSDGLTAGWLDDPEFRYDAVAALVKEGEGLAKKGSKEEAIAVYRKAFAAVRDLEQGATVARHLKDVGETVSVADHFGFLCDWYAVGPFDAMGMKGFQTTYPPETKVDLAAEYDGQAGKVRWKRYRVPEPAPAALDPRRGILVNLIEPLGNATDAVAYAYTTLTVPEAVAVEFRGAADDNLTVWVNGKREFGFEEYRNGVRLDRHRFRVKLKAGENTVLVKVCQAAADPTNNEPNWEFVLRVVDATGKGIALGSVLPKKN